MDKWPSKASLENMDSMVYNSAKAGGSTKLPVNKLVASSGLEAHAAAEFVELR